MRRSIVDECKLLFNRSARHAAKHTPAALLRIHRPSLWSDLSFICKFSRVSRGTSTTISMADSETPNPAVDPVEDDDYDSASDDDFNPDGAPPEDISSSSEDEPESSTKATPKGKRKRKTEGPEELDSGDEVTIQAKQKAKKRKETGDDNEVIVFSDDEGGEGGLIKTRAQKRTEKKEHRRLAKTDGATIDVDSIWARLNSTPVGREHDITAEEKAQNEEKKAGGKSQEKPGEEYISIKRTYKFAGEVHTEEKRVLKSSKEAQLYLSQQAGEKDESEKENAKDLGDATPLTDAQPSIRRPLRRPSRFDPNPSGWVKALPPEHQLTWPRKSIPAATTTDTTTAPIIPQRVRASDLKPQKLNTVDKSRYDWAGYVDKEGIAEELDEYGKSKEGYLGRMDFLKSVESRQEDTRREVRLSTAANGSKPAPVDMAD